ncbi:MAG: hypothetical protein O3A01_03230 [bacterium]|nr:hypothetical protein [bacterium]
MKYLGWKLGWGLLAITIAIEPFLHRKSHFGGHGIASIDSMIGFYALLAFFGCIFLMVISRVLGQVIAVEEEYYDA